MSINFCPLVSGSDGNSVYIGTDNTHILVDAGVSCKKLELYVNSIHMSLHNIDAILITHEHYDHINGIGVISRKYNIPIYATERTWNAIEKKNSTGNIYSKNKREIYKQEKFFINDLAINPFPIPHDAVDTTAYTLEHKGHKVAVATDFGHASEIVKENLINSDALLIDCNHDVEMLENGRYPRNLKSRILSKYGHLSNNDSANLISFVAKNRLKNVFLGHISKDNNDPTKALETVKAVLTANELNEQINLHIVKDDSKSNFLKIS